LVEAMVECNDDGQGRGNAGTSKGEAGFGTCAVG
jgi:hypothetical protein